MSAVPYLIEPTGEENAQFYPAQEIEVFAENILALHVIEQSGYSPQALRFFAYSAHSIPGSCSEVVDIHYLNTITDGVNLVKDAGSKVG
jgi:hypothetical protein